MAGLTACEKVILFDDIAPEPMLVVNGMQHVGQPARLNVEKSSFYINAETDLRVKDVHVNLYVNGAFKESLHVRDSMIMETYWTWSVEEGEVAHERPRYAFNYCEGEYILCEGDVLRFEVSSSEFDEVAVAETTIPYPPNVVSFDTTRVVNSDIVYFALTLDDPIGKDYYNLNLRDGFDVGFESSDPVFADFMNIVHIDDLFGGSEYQGKRWGYNMFNDSYFDGMRYSVSLHTHAYYDHSYVMEVSKVDYNLYQFQKSYSNYEYTDDGLLGLVTEPTQVYSNVQNGLGVVCSQSSPITVTATLPGED